MIDFFVCTEAPRFYLSMKIMVKILFYFLAVSYYSRFTESLKNGDFCRDGRSKCTSLAQCPPALRPISTRYYPLLCGIERSGILVCCSEPKTSSTAVVNDAVNFGKQKSQRIAATMCNSYTKSACNGTLNLAGTPPIVGGVPSKPKQFPHMALIGYGAYKKVSWDCAGSLISERYILSAAHCAISSLGKARWARLGELDLNSKAEDADPHDYEIVDQIVHPNYKEPSLYNDIALFRLNMNIRFSAYIRPVCLNTFVDLPKEKLNNLIASGWGATGYGEMGSSIMLLVKLHFIEYEKCKHIYPPDPKLAHGIHKASMICAGYSPGGKDACLGDSGGPLQFLNSEAGCPLIYNQIGIISFGKGCGLKDSAGVYTKIAHYIPWIESIVWKQ